MNNLVSLFPKKKSKLESIGEDLLSTFYSSLGSYFNRKGMLLDHRLYNLITRSEVKKWGTLHYAGLLARDKITLEGVGYKIEDLGTTYKLIPPKKEKGEPND